MAPCRDGSGEYSSGTASYPGTQLRPSADETAMACMPPDNEGPMTMDTDNREDTGRPGTIGPVKIEWNFDFDNRWHEMKSVGSGDEKYTFGEEGRFRLKGRCRRCWGGLIGKGAKEDVLTAIRCRVCGILLEGDEAREEYRRMSEQDASNTFQMAYGFPPKYRDEARFVSKIFPHIDRQTAEEFNERTSAEAQEGPRKDWLTRREFPGGSAGFLFLQARALMSGVERLPRELSVVRFWDFDMHDDGSTTVHVPTKELSEDPRTSENELMKRLGSTMTIAMMSAFACELAMKAIRLTRMDEARRSHDLWQLYRDLPEDSRARMEEDFPEVGSVLKKAQHTFGKWRYFEANVGGRGISAMIDTDRAFALAKAARVLLDEAELMGLGYSLDIDATQKVTKAGDRQDVHVIHKMHTTAREAPPRGQTASGL